MLKALILINDDEPGNGRQTKQVAKIEVQGATMDALKERIKKHVDIIEED